MTINNNKLKKNAMKEKKEVQELKFEEFNEPVEVKENQVHEQTSDVDSDKEDEQTDTESDCECKTFNEEIKHLKKQIAGYKSVITIRDKTINELKEEISKLSDIKIELFGNLKKKHQIIEEKDKSIDALRKETVYYANEIAYFNSLPFYKKMFHDFS